MAKTIKRGNKKEYIDRPAGIKENNYALTCMNIEMAEPENEKYQNNDKTRTDNGAIRDILSTEIGPNVIIKAETGKEQEESIQE